MSRSHATSTRTTDYVAVPEEAAGLLDRAVCHSTERIAYVVVGHACESSDILTPAPHDPERLFPRLLRIGDLLMIADTGAYCAAMCAKGYNAFPQTPEVFV